MRGIGLASAQAADWPCSFALRQSGRGFATDIRPVYRAGVMLTVLPLTPGRKLKLFQSSDPYKQWWSLEETRFCARCEHLIIGRDIRVFEDGSGCVHFRCPTLRCEGGFGAWEYPQLHL